MGRLTTKEINIIGAEIANGVAYADSEIPDSDEKLEDLAGPIPAMCRCRGCAGDSGSCCGHRHCAASCTGVRAPGG